MKKKNILLIVLIVLVLIGIGSSVYYFGFKDKEETKEEVKLTDDEKKFKEEYESLNDTVRESTGVANPNMEVIEDNNVVYLSDEETVNFLEKGTGIIYMGFKECPWCRNAVPVLLKATTNASLEKVFYLDVTDIKSTIILDAKNKPKTTKEGTDAYYKILELLDDYLADYNLVTDKGKKVPTGEKRIFSPTVVTVKDGVVVGFHVGTVDDHVKGEDGFLPYMTDEQEEELYGIYEEMISKISGSNCNDGCD